MAVGQAPNVGVRCERCQKTFEVYWRRTTPFPRFCSQYCGTRGKAPRKGAGFWAKVQKSEGDGCWLWSASVNAQGYGQFKKPGVRRCVLAHRYAWELSNGPIPDGLHVLHRCDRPACVRLDHLFLGTNQDNIADRVAKGRYRGTQVPGAKLNDELVRELRSLSGQVPQRKIAERLGVSVGAVVGVIYGRAWRHVS